MSKPLDDAAKSAVNDFRSGKSSEAVSRINTTYNGINADARDFTKPLIEGLHSQHLIASVANEIFGSEAQFRKLDRNNDGKIDKDEIRNARNPNSNVPLTRFEQAVANYLDENREAITGEAGGGITRSSLHSYADKQTQASNATFLAQRFKDDPNGVMAKFDTNADGVISPLELSTTQTYAYNELRKHTDSKEFQELKIMADAMQQQHDPITDSRWDNNGDSISRADMAKWSTSHLEDYKPDRLPNYSTTRPVKAEDGSVEAGKEGFVPDLIKEYTDKNFKAMAGNDGYLSWNEFTRYKELRSGQSPAEDRILGEIEKRWGDIYDSGTRFSTQYISEKGFATYAEKQAAAREEQRRAQTADFRDENGQATTPERARQDRLDLAAAAEQQRKAQEEAQQRIDDQKEAEAKAKRDTEAAAARVKSEAEYKSDVGKALSQLSPKDREETLKTVDAAVAKQGKDLDAAGKEQLRDVFIGLETNNAKLLHKLVPFADQSVSPATRNAFQSYAEEHGLNVKFDETSDRQEGGNGDAGFRHGSMTIVPQAGGDGVRLNYNRDSSPDSKPTYKDEAIKYDPKTGRTEAQPNSTKDVDDVLSETRQKADQDRRKAEQDRRQAEQDKVIDKYIKDYFVDKGGFTGDKYAEAVTTAAKHVPPLPVVMVMSKGYEQELVGKLAREAVSRNDAVYVYVDTTKLPAGSELAKYADSVIKDGKTSAIVSFNVTADSQGHLANGNAHYVNEIRPYVPPPQPRQVQQPAYRPGYGAYCPPGYVPVYPQPVYASPQLYQTSCRQW